MEKHAFQCFWSRGKLSLYVIAFSLFSGWNVVSSIAAASEKATTVTEETQQKRMVQGVISSDQNEVIIGATVHVKGTARGTMTDENGKFSIEAATDAILEITYIGYLPQNVVAKTTTLNITLKEDSKQLGEILVTGFGLSQRKETLTGAVSTVTSKDIARSSSSTTSGALVGKIAGINSRQADGRPGASTSIQIRNMGTPLYVIDGIIQDEGQFNNIDFNDIESISILKDASAAIYGVRSANGVVVVNTKKGDRNTKPSVTLNATYGWQNLSTFTKPADAPTYIQNYIQSETIEAAKNRTYTVDDLAKWKAGTEKGYVPFDWYKFIWGTAPQTYVGVNISGGDDKTSYYVAVSHLNQDAMIKQYGGFTRSNIQMNIESKITDKLKVGASMNGRIEERTNPGVPGGDDYWCPIFAVYRNLPMARPYANDNPKYPAKTSNSTDVNFAMLNYELSGKMVNTWRVAQFNFNAEYELFKGLKAKGLFGYYMANNLMNNQEFTYDLFKYNESTDTYSYVFRNTNPWKERAQSLVEKISSNVQLAYDNTFGKNGVQAVLAMEASTLENPHSWMHSIPASNALTLFDYTTIDRYDDYGVNTEARIGYIGRLNYNYDQKYLLELSARYDGSWKFPPTHRWGLFPSISAGWRITEENFWKNSSLANAFSDLKLRGSYGLLGDDNVDGYNAFDFMTGYNYMNGGSTIDGKYTIGTSPRNLPVTNLTWIKAKVLDIGLDVSFFQNRLSGTFDYFERMRTGLTAPRYDVLLPSEVGFDLPRENLNSDASKGVDAMIRWSDKLGELHYSIGANATYARRYDWHQYKPRFSNSLNVYRSSINERYSYITWGYKNDGQFQSWEEIADYDIDNDGKGNTSLRPGDIKYKDLNGDKRIDALDESAIGYRQGSTPNLNFGFNFSFQYKAWDLAFDLTGASGASWYQNWETRYPFHDGGNNPQYYMEDTWRLSDIMDANSELIPGKYPTLLTKNGSSSNHSNNWTSDFWMHNINYMKLRNLEFGYNVPKTIIKKVGITSLRFYFSGQNLLTFSNLQGTDPEITSDNGLQYPTTRIMNLGLILKY